MLDGTDISHLEKLNSRVKYVVCNILKKSKHKYVKAFNNGPSKIFGKQPLKNVKWYGLLRHLNMCKKH